MYSWKKERSETRGSIKQTIINNIKSTNYVYLHLYSGHFHCSISRILVLHEKQNSQQAQVVNNTDFKAEFANAEQYKNLCLNSDLSFLKEAMGEEKLTLSTMPAMSMV